MTRGKIVTLSTAGFYLLLILFILSDPGSAIGSCSSGLNALAFFSLPFLAAGGLILSLVVWATGHGSAKGSAFINGAILIGFFLLLLALGWLH